MSSDSELLRALANEPGPNEHRRPRLHTKAAYAADEGVAGHAGLLMRSLFSYALEGGTELMALLLRERLSKMGGHHQ